MGVRDNWPDPGELVSYEAGLRDCIQHEVMTHEEADYLLINFIRSKFGGVFEHYMGPGTD